MWLLGLGQVGGKLDGIELVRIVSKRKFYKFFFFFRVFTYLCSLLPIFLILVALG